MRGLPGAGLAWRGRGAVPSCGLWPVWDGRASADKFRMQFPQRRESPQATKRWNDNDLTPEAEMHSGELHAKLLWFVAVVARSFVTAHVNPIGGALGPFMRTWAR